MKTHFFLPVFFILLSIVFPQNSTQAEVLFDATGTWKIETSNDWDTCFKEDESITFYFTIVQDGDTFSCIYDDQPGEGSIDGPTYQLRLEYADGDGIKSVFIQFSLSESEKGSGYCFWNWRDESDDADGLGYCAGYRVYQLTKKSDSTDPVEDEFEKDDSSCFVKSLFEKNRAGLGCQ